MKKRIRKPLVILLTLCMVFGMNMSVMAEERVNGSGVTLEEVKEIITGAEVMAEKELGSVNYAALSTVFVSNEAELIAAAEDAAVNVIIVNNDIELTAPLNMNHSVTMLGFSEVKLTLSSLGYRHIITAGEAVEIIMTNITLYGKGVSYGGGIEVRSGSLTLYNAFLQSCFYNRNGGGIYLHPGTGFTIDSTAILSNGFVKLNV